MEITFYAHGHREIRATHRSTIEITKENYLTPKGDCIIAVQSELACNGLPKDIKKMIKTPGTQVKLVLEGGGYRDIILAWGSDKLLLTSNTSIVIRKSQYIDDRTLAINANKSAAQLNRNLIKYLQKEGKIKITIIVHPPR